MSLIRHLAIHEVNVTNNKSGEDDEEETIDAATTNVYDDIEEHKTLPKSPLLLFDDKKSLSEEDINEIENQDGE